MRPGTPASKGLKKLSPVKQSMKVTLTSYRQSRGSDVFRERERLQLRGGIEPDADNVFGKQVDGRFPILIGHHS